MATVNVLTCPSILDEHHARPVTHHRSELPFQRAQPLNNTVRSPLAILSSVLEIDKLAVLENRQTHGS